MRQESLVNLSMKPRLNQTLKPGLPYHYVVHSYNLKSKFELLNLNYPNNPIDK